MRITDEELELLKSTFANNERLVLLMRKIFLPEVDYDAPIGQVIDLYLSLKTEDVTPEQALINLKARNTLVTHVESCLLQISMLAGQKEESVEETKERLQKDSTR